MKKNWPQKVFFLSFLLAVIFSGLSTYCADLNVLLLTIILILVIFIGIVFDMIGVATLTSRQATFHAMSSKKIKGAKQSLFLIKNNSLVSSVCNDVIGDICGIVSGSLGASLTAYLVFVLNANPFWITIFVTALISSLTVGGKAFGKQIAIKKCDQIVYVVGKFLQFVHFQNIK